MNRLSCTLALAVVAILFHPSGGVADVKVEEDEVIFTLSAGGARDVFLVGDFNNWNPTLEKLDRNGDVFEVRLFLLPGTYRYKFVADGRWINDPDNPPVVAERGSAIKLVMRGGMLAIAGEDVIPEGAAALALSPSIRYTGRFSVDAGETDTEQTLDFYFNYESERARSRVDFKTTDDSWDLSPVRTDVRLNNGYLELRFDNATIRAFENEETWTSSDPLRLVGDVGIYNYNAGWGRKGAGIELGTRSKIRLRALYADRVEARLQTPVTIPAADLADFAASAAPDTTVYRYDSGLEDEDTGAIDLLADFGGIRFGYVARRNRGYHPGALAVITRGSGDFTVEAFGTREDWSAGSAWIAWKLVRNLTLEGAYGYGNTVVKRLTRSESVLPSLGDVGVAQDAGDNDSDSDLQRSHRWRGVAVYQSGAWMAGADFEWNQFDFEPGVYKASNATIAVAGVSGAITLDRWTVGGTSRYVDQDYGGTPDDFHFHTRNRNPWLDYGDDLTVAHMAGFDLPRMSQMNMYATWSGRDSLETVRAECDLVSREFFRSVDYFAVRAAVEVRPWWRLYLQADGRLAVYDKTWSRETFFAPYVEAGYRHRGLEFSLGVGLDPIVLDPVTNQYRDNGRQEYLRAAAPARPLRSQSQSLGVALMERERRLKDVSAIKLEAIMSF